MSSSEPKKSRSPRVWVFAAIGTVAVIAVLAAATAFFRVNALTRNAVIGVVPADAEMYIEIDLLEVSEENFQVLIDAFSDPLDDGGVAVHEADDILTLFDDVLHDEFRMTVEDDVMPWIGRHIAAAAFDTVPSTTGYDDGYFYLDDWLQAWAIPWGDAEGETLLAIQVREPDLADEFLLDLADEFEDQGWSVRDRTIEDLDFFEVEEIVITDDYDYYYDGELVFGRSDDVVLMSGSMRLIREAIETQTGARDSILDSDGFLATTGSLPDDPFIRGYWSEAGVKGFSESYGQMAEFDRRASGALGSVGAAGWFTDSGFRVTSNVAVDTEKLPDDAVTWLEQLPGSDPLALMPDGQVTYYAVHGYGLLLSAYCELTGDEWYCDEAREASDVVAIGGLTRNSDFRDMDMIAFSNDDAARSFVEADVTRFDDAEMVSDQGGNVLWTVEWPDSNSFNADAVIGSTGWSWYDRSDTPEQRTDDAIDEFESLADAPHLKIPAEAVASLQSGSVPLSFMDFAAGVATLEASEQEWERDSADMYRPFLWAIAGLAWDGTRLHASGALEWQP